MTRIQVQAGQTLLEGYVKTPETGLCELIWNAFDEDAERVSITIERSDMGAVDQIVVEDDGNGLSRIGAEGAFSSVGDSWKRMPGTLSEKKRRPVHGRHGRGRYGAFALGGSVRWSSVAESLDGLEGVSIRGNGTDLQHFEVENVEPERDQTGMRINIGQVLPAAADLIDAPQGIVNRLLTEFALHLDRFKDFRIDFLGSEINPERVQEDRTELDIELPEECPGKATLTVIEWSIKDVDRKLYLCTAEGSIVDELAPGVRAPGAEFTAYLSWDGFTSGQPLALEHDTETPVGKVIQAARDAMREHLLQRSRVREAEVIKKWKAEGVYPYSAEPKGSVERATRAAFNVVAMAASRTVDESKSQQVKALSLSLLRETFESDPQALLPILKKVTKLPQSRIEELKELLDRTELSELIQVGREVGDRLDFVQGLNAILFDRATRKSTKERRQLHRILAHETWIFGEEWSLTGDDERLTEVLKKFQSKLGHEVELANSKPVLRADGSDAIPDLVLGRRRSTSENHYSHLVVELKRPSHKLKDEDVTQLRSYASAIVNDERFAQPNVAWDFLLVGNDTSPAVDEMREQEHLPFGVVQASKKYRIVVKKWAEVIGDAEHRLKFVEKSLRYRTDHEYGLEYLRSKYSKYLPEEALLKADAGEGQADNDEKSA